MPQSVTTREVGVAMDIKNQQGLSLTEGLGTRLVNYVTGLGFTEENGGT